MTDTKELMPMDVKHAANLLHCVLFLSPGPVKMEDIRLHFRIEKDTLNEAILELRKMCGGTGLELLETATGLELATRAEYVQELKLFFAHLEKSRISRAALETLAIIAYKQPITRAEIENIRGVNSQGVINALLDKGLLKICGKSEAAGRAFLFTITDEFLRFIGAKSIEDIPPLDALKQKV